MELASRTRMGGAREIGGGGRSRLLLRREHGRSGRWPPQATSAFKCHLKLPIEEAMNDSIYVPLWLVVGLAVFAAGAAGFFGGRATASHSKSAPVADVAQAATGLYYDPQSDASAARADLLSAIPSVEAYFSNNGTYAGVTADELVASYDQSFPSAVQIVSASATTYCVQTTSGSATWHKAGPAARSEAGSCP
jgi:hypothetical protein